MTVNKKFNFLKPFLCKDLSRIGNNFDGGYVVSKSVIKSSKYIISCGIGNQFSFEEDLIKYNCFNFYLYDHTVNAISYLKLILKYFRRFITLRLNYKILINSLLDFYNYLILIKSNRVNFFPREVCNKSDKNRISLTKILADKEDVTLKIDIEGNEYKILNSIINNRNKLLMLIIEFHYIQKNKQKFLIFFKKLLKDFSIIHIHGNNNSSVNIYGIPDVLEVTIIKNNKNIISKKKIYSFPTKYDFPNNPNLKDIDFRFNY